MNYDAIIIGGGSGGSTTARVLARAMSSTSTAPADARNARDATPARVGAA